MKVDVSEIKTFKACHRQWQLSSRNKFHLQPLVTPPQFEFGTLFHESLAQLYLGVSVDKVMAMVRKEMRSDTDAALLAMIPGYAREVLPGDLDRFKVLDIEHHFDIVPCTSDGDNLFPVEEKKDEQGNIYMEPSLTVCGSIDMIVLDREQNKVYGFEHKTCKAFRDSNYVWMDEQPRVYTWALQQFVQEYNQRQLEKWAEACRQADAAGCTCPEEPEPVTLGGVYLNEVKKLLRDFQYQRTLCTYTEEDMDNFMQAFFNTCTQCKHMVDNNDYAAPQPSYFGCKMCAFNTICTSYMYGNLNKQEILKEFNEEFKERTEDHLEEKAERCVEDK